MSTIDVTMTLGDLVKVSPRLIHPLERHHLDYCCRGGRTLEAACAEEGLDPAAVLAELRAMVADGDDRGGWEDLGLVELVDHIESTHHRYLWDTFPVVGEMMERILDAHSVRIPEVNEVAAVFGELVSELEPHLRKEEQVLFPMVRELADAQHPPTFHCGSLSNPISVMLAEHDRAGALLERLRAVTNDYRAPEAGCATVRAAYRTLAEIEADTHLHVYKENEVLFPAVLLAEERLRAA